MVISPFGDMLRLAALLTPALVVLVLHALVTGLWQRASLQRVRRRADAALMGGGLDAVRRASAAAAETCRDWPGADLRAVRGALEVSRRRLECGAGRAVR